jgi:hypothetical protein
MTTPTTNSIDNATASSPAAATPTTDIAAAGDNHATSNASPFVLSPASRCHRDHLSSMMTFLSMRDFLSALRACREWRAMAELNSAWPSPPSIESLIDYSRPSDVPTARHLTFASTIASCAADEGSHAVTAVQLARLDQHPVWRRVMSLTLSSSQRDVGQLDPLVEAGLHVFPSLPHLTALDLDVSVTPGMLPAFEVCFRAVGEAGRLEQLTVGIHANSKVLISALPLLATSLRVLDMPILPQRSSADPPILRQLTQLVSLTLRSDDTPLDIACCLVLRHLSIHGHLRHLAVVGRMTYSALNALVLGPSGPATSSPPVADILEEARAMPPAALTHLDLSGAAGPSTASTMRILELPQLRTLQSRVSPLAWIDFEQLREWTPDQLMWMTTRDALTPYFLDDLERSGLTAEVREHLLTDRRAASLDAMGRLESIRTHVQDLAHAIILMHGTQLRRLCIDVSRPETVTDGGLQRHAQYVEQLILTLPQLQELSLGGMFLMPVVFHAFAQLRELQTLEVTAPMLVEFIRPLATLPALRRLILNGDEKFPITAPILHLIGQSPSLVSIELIGIESERLPPAELDSSLVVESYSRLKHLRVQVNHVDPADQVVPGCSYQLATCTTTTHVDANDTTASSEPQPDQTTFSQTPPNAAAASASSASSSSAPIDTRPRLIWQEVGM